MPAPLRGNRSFLLIVFILSSSTSLCVAQRLCTWVYVRVFCRRLSPPILRGPGNGRIQGVMVMRRSHATAGPKQFEADCSLLSAGLWNFLCHAGRTSNSPRKSRHPHRRRKFLRRLRGGNSFIPTFFSLYIFFLAIVVQLGQTFGEICFYYNAITRDLY